MAQNQDTTPIAAASGADRRKTPRADLVVRVDYHTIDELFSDFARNINEGGLFVETENPHELGTFVKLQFQIPGSSEPIQVSGIVVRISDGSEEPAGMGIEFENLDDAARGHINELVRKLRSDAMGQDPHSG